MAYDIERVFVVIMENRSFDHMLGYLHQDNPAVDGIRRDDAAWLANWTNSWEGEGYAPHQSANPGATIAADPPHGRATIAEQMGMSDGGAFAMDGFASTYAKAKAKPRVDAAHPPASMGWFDAADVPVFDFLARNFAVCSRWFCSLPAGTQPNRMMAMGGSSKRDDNHFPLPDQRLVYDWLNERNIRWRVYHDGIPFFAMMPKWAKKFAIDKHFRSFDKMQADALAEGPSTFPQVVFIEPTYADAPHRGASNDDHAPEGIAEGQAFLHKVYRAITCNPAMFEKSITIITYDEHGGFFDHVSPPAVRTEPPPGGSYPAFETLGVRVPALIVSPHVKPGTVSGVLHDHCSILKLLGALFGNGWGYEPPVNARPVGDVLAMLNEPAGRAAPTPPPLPPAFASAGRSVNKSAGGGPAAVGKLLAAEAAARAGPGDSRVPGTEPANALQMGFQMALETVRALPPDEQAPYSDLLAAFPPDPAAAAVSPLPDRGSAKD